MLKRVSIQNFKSLKDVTLDLQKVNLLIGPNNSGKTNFLKALEFVKETQNGVSGSKYKSITFNKYGDPVIIDLYTDYSEKLLVSRKINIQGDIENSFSIDDLDMRNENIESHRIEQGRKRFNLDASQIKIYTPQPSQVRDAYPLGSENEIVFADGSNIIAFLDNLQDNHRSKFDLLENTLRICLPEFSYIAFRSVQIDLNSELAKKYFNAKETFKKIGLQNKINNIIYWSDELSEGALYFLILLCIIHQPNPPKLLLLEEPEKGIHPRRIWEVMKFIFQLAEEKDIQIILTTHNEHVVDAFSSMPESIFVFEKDEETGVTTVRNLQKNIIEPSHKKSEELGIDKVDFTTNLGENWLYGLIGGVPADVL